VTAQVALRNVSKTFPAGRKTPALHALGPIDLELRRGEFFAVVGPSGCGKSTLLEIIAGLVPPTEGSVEFEGQPIVGEAPDSIVLIETADEVESLEVADPAKVAFITQTTLSVDETAEVIAALRAKFPGIVSSKSDDICYATTNRQIAVKQLARECELVLVIGSTNSSNSNRLVEVAREHGAASYLIDNHTQVDEAWLEGVETVGITSGASAPEELVERLVDFFRERGADDVSELRTVHEDVRFMLPKEIRDELAARA